MPLNCLLKKKYYQTKNLIRIMLIKHTALFISFIVIVMVGLYLLYSNIMGEYSKLQFASDIKFTDLIPFIGEGLVIVAGIIAYIVLYFSYKSSLEEWNFFLYTPISSNQLYFFAVCSYSIMILGLIILLMFLILLVMHANITFILQTLYSISVLSLGNILFSIFAFRILKKKYQNQSVFQILSFILVVLFSVPLLLCLRLDEFQNNHVYIMFTIPLILGIVGNSIIRKKPFVLLSCTSFHIQRDCRSYKVKNELLSLLKIETIRNKRLLIELSITPYLCLLIFYIFSYPIQESIIFMLLALSSTFFIGIPNSYLLIFKRLPYSKFYFFIVRISCGIVWGILEYIILSFMYPKLLGIGNLILLITWILMLMLLVNLLQIPMLKNGKEHVAFYQVISLVPSIYLLFMDIVNSFLINTWNITQPIQLIENAIIVIVLVCVSVASE